MYTVTKRNRLIALGGTFDHFHKGHEAFIEYAFTYSKKLIIGVTDDSFTNRKAYPESIQPYVNRARAVHHYCKRNDIPHEIIALSDPYGPTIDKNETKIDSLCVTKETLEGAEKINEIRDVMHMRELPIFIAPFFNNDQGEVLHAIQIRSGKVNRDGVTYLKYFADDIKINQKQRHFFSNPLGPITKTATHKKNKLVAVVGDYALSQFIENGWSYTIGVYDNLTQRKPFEHDQIDTIKADIAIDNPAGTISKDSQEKIYNLTFDTTQHIQVSGEEDLVTVTLILAMPLDSLIYYGQPNEGMVILKVTEELKERIFKLLRQ